LAPTTTNVIYFPENLQTIENLDFNSTALLFPSPTARELSELD